MKANELQIGNWVKLNDPLQSGYVQISEIRKDKVLTTYQYGTIGVKIEFIEPIPITKEWLKENGFERFYNDICEFTYFTKEIGGHFVEVRFECSNTSKEHVVCHVDNCDRCTIGSADIRYVHQLQNFLTALNIKMDVKL